MTQMEGHSAKRMGTQNEYEEADIRHRKSLLANKDDELVKSIDDDSEEEEDDSDYNPSQTNVPNTAAR